MFLASFELTASAVRGFFLGIVIARLFRVRLSVGLGSAEIVLCSVLVTGSLLAASRYLVAAVFCQRRVLCFPAGLPVGYPFRSVCGVVTFVSGIRVLGLGPVPF